MANVSTHVSFRLTYIGHTDPHSDAITCKHGESECLGNIIELCAASLYPDPKIYLGFVNCMSKHYQDIPQRELVHDCALEHNVVFDELNECMSKDDGVFGMGLLRSSVERSASLNVSTSCTIRLDGRMWCVRDGGEWKDCERGRSPDNLIADIEKLYYN